MKIKKDCVFFFAVFAMKTSLKWSMKQVLLSWCIPNTTFFKIVTFFPPTNMFISPVNAFNMRKQLAFPILWNRIIFCGHFPIDSPDWCTCISKFLTTLTTNICCWPSIWPLSLDNDHWSFYTWLVGHVVITTYL